MATIIVGAVVLVIVFLAGLSVYKDTKKGSCASCGCGCSSCNSCSGCNQQKD